MVGARQGWAVGPPPREGLALRMLGRGGSLPGSTGLGLRGLEQGVRSYSSVGVGAPTIWATCREEGPYCQPSCAV